MSERTARGRPAQRASAQSWLARDRWRLWIGVYIILMIVLATGTFILARNVARGDLTTAHELIEQLQSESQKLKRANADQGAQINSLQGKLAAAQSALEAVMPTQNIYNLSPNQSLFVANSHMMLGLVGPPGNENITLNVNGKQQTVVAGQTIAVAPDSSTNCLVNVQSFDMFKAIVAASCAPAK